MKRQTEFHHFPPYYGLVESKTITTFLIDTVCADNVALEIITKLRMQCLFIIYVYGL